VLTFGANKNLQEQVLSDSENQTETPVFYSENLRETLVFQQLQLNKKAFNETQCCALRVSPPTPTNYWAGA